MKSKKPLVSYKTAAGQREKRDKYYKVISLIGFFIVWECLGRINLHTEWIEPKFLPMPSEILMAAFSYLTQGTLWEHVSISLYRVIVGYLWGIGISLALGGLIASNRAADNIATPVLNLFGPIPIMAFLPMFILWFGIGERSKIILIAYATVMFLIPYVTEGLKNTDSVLIRSAVSLGATPMQMFWHVKFQSAFPHIFVGMKNALSAAFGAMVVAEMLGASTGLGYIIVFSKNWFKMPDMMMAAMLIGLMYSAIFGVLTLIENLLFKWKKTSVSNAIEN